MLIYEFLTILYLLFIKMYIVFLRSIRTERMGVHHRADNELQCTWWVLDDRDNKHPFGRMILDILFERWIVMYWFHAVILWWIEIEWKGTGVDEKGYDKATGRLLVDVNPRYFRPAEVDLLLGDSSKARRELGWMPKYALPMLVKEMVQSDLELAKKEKTLREHGYKVLLPQEV